MDDLTSNMKNEVKGRSAHGVAVHCKVDPVVLQDLPTIAPILSSMFLNSCMHSKE